MPCWEVRTQTTDFTKAVGHEDLLADALRELGYNVQRTGNQISFSGRGTSGYYSGGRFNTQGNDFNADEAKQAFGGQVVKKAAKQFGWRVKQGKTKYSYVISKGQ
jgi:hypothetical protein